MSRATRPQTKPTRASHPDGLLPGPAGWLLAAEGAALHEASRTAVIADVHLGYEWARARAGDVVPAHSLAETLARLESLRQRFPFDRLIVAGDLVESRQPCQRTARDVAALRRWFDARGIALSPLRGNHDPVCSASGPETIDLDGWTIGHGHRPLQASRTLTGHLHPSLRVGAVAAPCFLIASDRIILPAFTPNAAGWNILGGLPDFLDAGSTRCIATLGGTILDFGTWTALSKRLIGSPSQCRAV